MKLAIMQPYAFPYIGYYQLLKLVDLFVIHDDVQWIKGGWINRNRILVEGAPKYFTLPVAKSTSYAKINERSFPADKKVQLSKVYRQIENNYRQAPCFEECSKLLRECFEIPTTNIATFITETIIKTARYLSIETPIIRSSELKISDNLKGQERVIEINKKLDSSHYINPEGGVSLYQKERFEIESIKLSFLKAKPTDYQQRKSSEFQPFLSIIDVLMNNTPNQITPMLQNYVLF